MIFDGLGFAMVYGFFEKAGWPFARFFPRNSVCLGFFQCGFVSFFCALVV